MEYVIKQDERNYLCGAVFGPLQHASVFKVKARAIGLLAKYPNCTVEPYWGKPAPQGTKSFTVPKKSPINRTSAYRSM